MGKVLIVDDQPVIRKLLFEVLDDEFDVRFAETGEEAIVISQDFKPDVILLDIGLAGMSGVEAIPEFKKLSPKSNIIMLTGSANGSLINKALSCGASDCITKPFDIFELKTRLENIISKQSAV
ncbi:KDP operon transcriptional regulatory protein KdpE [Oxobacter pfennigii]|uniref:Stage 0 sporulation protein A homolog n=1 Tax=Oxobacter pfennigii TaxID=36849 RepID=A0A0P8W7G8_9CLOT|nr:response regulator [Oxobacter pfennigii]KPU44601.1 KDP operon transcriptional regulatory protein KdpE [Oxobacter pfennigii]